MKAVLVSSGDRGGGGLAAARLHRGLVESGTASRFFCRSASSALPNRQPFVPDTGKWPALARRFLRWRKNRLERHVLPSMSRLWGADHLARFGAAAARQIPAADVWNLHSVFDLFEYGAFFSAASRDTLIVWTLHQMGPFTGGCHYSQNCRRFEQSCGKCQYLSPGDDSRDASYQVWKAKKAVYDRVPAKQLAVVAPSRWMAGCAANSSLFARHKVHVIPYGLDLDTFRPHDRSLSRRLLGVPDSARVLLYVSQFDRMNPHKGFVHLERAISQLSGNRDLLCVAVGPANGESTISGVHLIETGSIEQEWIMPLIYSAADLLVVPSMEDNFPNVILEASACGIPVVGASVGGIPEMIEHGRTGLLVPRGDADAIASAAQLILGDAETRGRMGRAAREKCEREFSMRTQVERYLELFAAGVQELRYSQ